jgi:four helix bundle protein
MTMRPSPRELEDRLIAFAVKVARLTVSLPDTPPGRHVVAQIVRSGTAPAALYAEACAAESIRDFAHKLAIALKELRETRVWLLIIIRAELSSHNLSELIDETEQLIRIIAKSIVTARSRQKKH